MKHKYVKFPLNRPEDWILLLNVKRIPEGFPWTAEVSLTFISTPGKLVRSIYYNKEKSSQSNQNNMVLIKSQWGDLFSSLRDFA